ncbi:MAG TPA: chromosome partitioning protein [bacterium]|nr:chromosome partitioning protein [bacterium]
MIVILGGEKGGTGKTTLATNLAALRAIRGHDVLLIDTDRQESANFWALTRTRTQSGAKPVITSQKLGGSVLRIAQEPYRVYEDIIVDAGGRNSVELRATMTIADVLYIPIQPSQFDVWTLARMNELVGEARRVNPPLRARVILNRASTNPSITETRETIGILGDYDQLSFSGLVIHDRIVYRRAAARGLAVEEMEPPDPRAVEEMNRFYHEVYDGKTQPQQQTSLTQNP